MTKRYFKINLDDLCTETVVGTVAKDFAEHWKNRPEHELVDHLEDINVGNEGDEESPSMIDDTDLSWFMIDDYEHLDGVLLESQYTASEIELHPEAEIKYGELVWQDPDKDLSAESKFNLVEFGLVESFDNVLYSRECYTYTEDDCPGELDAGQDLSPALSFSEVDSGSFGSIYIVTAGEDFDPARFVVGVAETDQGSIIEGFWYDGNELTVDRTDSERSYSYSYATVGYINPNSHMSAKDFSPDSDFVSQSLESYYSDF